MGQWKGFLNYFFQDIIIALDPTFQSGVPDFFKYEDKIQWVVVILGANHKLLLESIFYQHVFEPNTRNSPNKSIHSL